MKYNIKEKEAIINCYNSGASISSIFSATNIPKSTLYDWIKPHSRISANVDYPPTIQEHNRLKAHCKKLESMIAVLQSVDCNGFSSLSLKLDTIELLQTKYSVNVLCDALKVPKGTYYNHILRNKRDKSSYAQRREELKPVIRSIYDEHRQIYGANKITAVLCERGYKTSPKTVVELMREMGLSSVTPPAKRDYLKWKKGENKNILQQKFRIDAPNKVWVSDVTYVAYGGIKYYFCAIMDLFWALA